VRLTRLSSSSILMYGTNMQKIEIIDPAQQAIKTPKKS
jgi:hypothetical protein